MQNGIPVGLRSNPSFGLSRSGQLTAIIQSLFWDGSQGWWYDDNDTTTLFQDSAGTTPVTAVEQFVGLQLDKSKGLVLGPTVISNGNFSNGTTGWIADSGCTLSASGGVLTVTTTADSAFATQQNNVYVVNKAYQVTFTYSVNNTTTARLRSGATVLWSETGSLTTKTVTAIVFPTTTTFEFGVTGGTVTEFYISNISVRELPGNHRYAPASGNRPIWSKRVNLVTYSQDFTNAAWVKTNASVSSTPVTAPDGTATANRVSFTTGTKRLVNNAPTTLPVNTGITQRLWAKGTVGGEQLRIFDGWTNTTPVTLTTSWVLYTLTMNASGTSNSYFIDCLTDNATVDIWGADLRPANQATGTMPLYQRVNTSSDYDTNGFPGYLKADGVDDFLQTNSIDFTATDKVTLCAGVRKLSDAVAGMITELSASTALNNGVFQLQTQTSGGYFFRSKGTSASDAGPSTGYNAPITDLLTGIGNISGDQSILRINGTQVASSATDQGTGNYGNYPAYFFQRNGPPAANRFNGNEYGNIAVGKLLTADQLTALETYMNGLTKAY